MFAPRNESHAIQEAVFTVTLGRPLDAHDVQSIKSNKAPWQEELPSEDIPTVLQLTVGNSGISPAAPMTPSIISYRRFRSDGTIEWRLHFEGNNLVVNCANYDRWDGVWPKVLTYLSLGSKILLANGNNIIGATIQYLNVFRWTEKTDKYDTRQLLSDKSDYIPRAFWGDTKSPLWHLHSGWFRPSTKVGEGKRLERCHLDAVMESGSYVVRIDNLTRVDFAQPMSDHAALFPQRINSLFADLHKTNKSVLASYLNEQMINRIGLWGNDDRN